MADETLNDTPDDSIASALASAISQHEKGAEAPVETKAKPVQEAPAEAAESDAAKTATEDQASEAEAGEPKEDAGAATETKEGEEKPGETSAFQPNQKWSEKDKALFAKQPADVQKFILDREKAMQGDYTRKMQEVSAFRREYDPVDKIFEPYRDRMKAGGWTPAKLVEAWSNVEKRLMEGDGVNVIAGLVRGYQVDMGQVARALGLRPQPRANGAATAQPDQPQPEQPDIQLPPQVAQQLETIQRRLEADDRARMDAARRQQTATEQRVMSEIDQFKSAVDDQGNLQHPHFDEVEEAMTHLAQSAAAAKKPVPSLAQLYETAVWANPETRKALLAAQERSQQEKRDAEARAKAAAARKAGSSVTGAPGSGNAPTGKNRADLSLRQQLEASFADQAGGRI